MNVSDFQYPKLVQEGKEQAAKGLPALYEWLNNLTIIDVETLKPYLPLLRAIAKNAHNK